MKYGNFLVVTRTQISEVIADIVANSVTGDDADDVRAEILNGTFLEKIPDLPNMHIDDIISVVDDFGLIEMLTDAHPDIDGILLYDDKRNHSGKYGFHILDIADTDTILKKVSDNGIGFLFNNGSEREMA